MQHKMNLWGTLGGLLLGLGGGLVLLSFLFCYQLDATETAVITRFGKLIAVQNEPGLHFRWPSPIDEIIKYDYRNRSFIGNLGQLDELQTQDKIMLIIGANLVWKIKDAGKFHMEIRGIEKANAQLDTLLRKAKLAIIGQHKFEDLLNTDKSKMKLSQVDNELKIALEKELSPLGIEVVSAGIHHIGVPEQNTKSVQDRMIEECRGIATNYKNEGDKQANQIRTEATRKASEILAKAEAEAKKIRGEGDAISAEAYAIFKESPELAVFLRELESLEKTFNDRTTLVLDTSGSPFHLLNHTPINSPDSSIHADSAKQ